MQLNWGRIFEHDKLVVQIHTWRINKLPYINIYNHIIFHHSLPYTILIKKYNIYCQNPQDN